MELAKGVNDKGPRESIAKQKVVNKIKTFLELYGYNPLQTPIIERESTLTNKFAGGEEILKEIYTLKDQGNRSLALRYDLTVPLARYIRLNKDIKLPFKRYQIGQVFRDGPIKPGRYREFTQFDADIVGSKDVFSDAELLKLAQEVFKSLNLDIVIKYNSREILNEILQKSQIKDKNSFILTLDKIEKIGEKGVRKELLEKGFDDEKISVALNLIQTDQIKPPKELQKYLDLLGVNADFTPTLARGLNYYTGTIFEVFLKNSAITSSIAAGGRYDNMIGDMAQGDYPAVGISFGVDTIVEAIGLGEVTSTKLLIIPIGEKEGSIKILSELRAKGVSCDLNLKNNVKKGLSFADSYNIPYVLLVGEEEMQTKKYTLRDMQSGKEQKLSLKDVIKKLC